MHNEGSMM